MRCEVSTKRVARKGIRIYPLAEHKLSINSKNYFPINVDLRVLGARPDCLVVRAHLIRFVWTASGGSSLFLGDSIMICIYLQNGID